MDIVICVFIVVLLGLSGFYSSCEIAFAKANAIRIKKQAEAGDKTAIKQLYINGNYTRSLSTILVGNNLVNISASSAATILCVKYLGDSLGPTVASISITVLLLIFGETLPKIIASAIPDKLAHYYTLPLRFFMILFFPIVWLVGKLMDAISPIWTPKEKAPEVTPQELMEIVDDIEDEGVFTEQESELIKSAIDITESTAMDVLIPRVDVFAIDIEDEKLELTEDFYTYSRIPVYHGSIDNIVGILPSKRLLRAIASGENYKLEDLIYKPIFVHMTKNLSSIIDELRNKHQQMAIVVDEYGGTMGILTMEDITEVIFGEIFDERDTVEDEILKVDENTYVVEGSMNIEDLFEILEWEPDGFETEYTTVGGWVTDMLDKFPKAGDEFEYQRIKVTVLKASLMRVESLRVVYKTSADNDEDE